MQLLKKIMIAIEKTNIFVGKLMVGVTLAAVAVITFEVVMRYVFGLPTNWGHAGSRASITRKNRSLVTRRKH